MMSHEKAINLYNQIVQFYAATGFMPRFRHMTVMAGVSSINTVYNYLRRLEALGWVERPFPGATCAITLTRPTEAGLTPDELRALLEAEPTAYTVTLNVDGGTIEVRPL